MGAVLSDKDIKKRLGKDIFIYPFREENLKGSTYNLTASICAWIVEDDKKIIIVSKDNSIMIPAGKTALIETEESIYVTKKICGTYHSKVKLCNCGLSHIGTTLDPCYFGTSVIALHNNSNKSVAIKVGDSIVSLMFYEMKSKSHELHDNLPFRKDLFDLNLVEFYSELENEDIKSKESGINQKKSPNEPINVSGDQQKYLVQLESWKNESWRTNREKLIKLVKKYVFERDLLKNTRRWICWTIVLAILLISILVFISTIVGNEKEKAIISVLDTLIGVIPPTATLIAGGIIWYFKKGEI